MIEITYAIQIYTGPILMNFIGVSPSQILLLEYTIAVEQIVQMH